MFNRRHPPVVPPSNGAMQRAGSSARPSVMSSGLRRNTTTTAVATATAPTNRLRNTSLVPSSLSDVSRVEGMNRQLQRINSRIEQKLQLYRHEAEASHHLLNRAQRLTERLDVLKHKLRMCFDVCGVAQPPHLQFVLQQMQTSNGAQDPDDAPAEFICPITQSVMIDPVRTSDGHVYDRAAIHEWFVGFQAKGQCPTSPLTNLPLADVSLSADTDLRHRIRSFLASLAPPDGPGAAPAAIEPSLRQLTLGSDAALPRGEGSVAVTLEEVRGLARPSGHADSRPIWTSAVVPPNEANSRELNMLRVSDVEMPTAMMYRGPPRRAAAQVDARVSATVARMQLEDEDEDDERAYACYRRGARRSDEGARCEDVPQAPPAVAAPIRGRQHQPHRTPTSSRPQPQPIDLGVTARGIAAPVPRSMVDSAVPSALQLDSTRGSLRRTPSSTRSLNERRYRM